MGCGGILNTFPRAVVCRRWTMTAHLSDGTEAKLTGMFIARCREGDVVHMEHHRTGHKFTMPVQELVDRFEPRSL